MFWELALIYGLISSLLIGMVVALWMLPWSEEETLRVHNSFMQSFKSRSYTTGGSRPLQFAKTKSHSSLV